jgi:prepilin-type N-terminal cleavage/methylation domain-containing protein
MPKDTYSPNQKRGFTILELLIVVAIMGVLSNVVISSVQGAKYKAEITKFYAESRELYTAIESFRLKKNYYPQEDINCTGVSSTIMGESGGGQSYYSRVQNPATQPPCTYVGTTTESGINQSHIVTQLKNEGLFNKTLRVPENMSFTYVVYRNQTDVDMDGPIMCGEARPKPNTAMIVVFVNDQIETIREYLPANRRKYTVYWEGGSLPIEESFCFYVD